MWSPHKQLIREINFPEAVNTLGFIDARGDLLLGHGTAQSLIYARQYAKDVTEFSEEELLQKSQEVTNERMYQLYVKDTGLQSKEQKMEAQEKLFAPNGDLASGSSEEEDLTELERLMESQKALNSKNIKEKVRANKLKKEQREATRIEN